MRAAITVRAAEFDDRAAMGRLWWELMEFHREYDRRFRHLDPGALDAWLERIDECMADSDHIILVAEAGGDVVAADNPVSTAFWRKMGLEPYAVHMRKRL